MMDLPIYDGGKASPRRIENSDMIQISCSMKSIWRGKLWSQNKLKIKINEYFLSKNDDNCRTKFVLCPSIEDLSSKTVYGSKSEKVKFRFDNCNNEDSSLSIVEKDPYNFLYVEIHQDLFNAGEKFRVVIEALPWRDLNVPEIIYGCSEIITVTDLALCIEQCFIDNPHCSPMENDKDIFIWYNKCGGENSGLDVKILLKDVKGRIVDTLSSSMKLRTELVYDDGSSCPLMPLSPLKERRSFNLSSKPLYRRLRPDPTLYPNCPCETFSFRVEEVSFHHSGHNGFKLKVSPVDSMIQSIHPGILEETIVVLSKPRTKLTSRKRKFEDFQLNHNFLMTEKSPETRNLSISSKLKTRKVSEDNEKLHILVSMPLDVISKSFCHNDSCIFCKRHVRAEDFLKNEYHNSFCSFIENILPFMSIKDPVKKAIKLESKEQERQFINETPYRTHQNKDYDSLAEEEETMMCHFNDSLSSNLNISPVTNELEQVIKIEEDPENIYGLDRKFVNSEQAVSQADKILSSSMVHLSPCDSPYVPQNEKSNSLQSNLDGLFEIPQTLSRIEPLEIKDHMKYDNYVDIDGILKISDYECILQTLL